MARAQSRIESAGGGAAGNAMMLHEFSQLKTPDQFAAKMVHVLKGRAMYKDTMLKWRVPFTSTLHTCLTVLERTKAKDSPHLVAKECFKRVLRVMGDKPSSTPEADAEYLLGLVLRDAPLRDEIYCQLLKQLTENQVRYSAFSCFSAFLLACVLACLRAC